MEFHLNSWFPRKHPSLRTGSPAATADTNFPFGIGQQHYVKGHREKSLWTSGALKMDWWGGGGIFWNMALWEIIRSDDSKN